MQRDQNAIKIFFIGFIGLAGATIYAVNNS